MKTLIKNYKHPGVDMSILTLAKQKAEKKNIYLILIQYIAWTAIFGLFLQNLIYLNIQYYSIFSGIGNIGIIFEVLFQVIVGMIHFVFNNIILLFSLYALSFVSYIYTINQKTP